MGLRDQLSELTDELEHLHGLMPEVAQNTPHERDVRELRDLDEATWAQVKAGIYIRGAIQQIEMALQICDDAEV